jgi:hypothetical protein
VFEVIHRKECDGFTQTLVLAMQFSRSAPRPFCLVAAWTRGPGAELDGGTRMHCPESSPTCGDNSFKTEQ